jgi:hypothetical protein
MTVPASCHGAGRSDEVISVAGAGDCFKSRAMTGNAGPRDRGFRIADCGLKKTTGANSQAASRKPRSAEAHHTGVTLTEVIVASVLLVVSIVPLLKALTLVHAQDRAIERKSWSLMLAQRELEVIRARCLRHYDVSYRRESRALCEGYLCTVADDEHPRLRTVTISVGLDRSGDGVLSGEEVEVRLSTRLARP